MVDFSINGGRDGVIEDVAADSFILVIFGSLSLVMVDGNGGKRVHEVDVGWEVSETSAINELHRPLDTTVDMATKTLRLEVMKGTVSVRGPI